MKHLSEQEIQEIAEGNEISCHAEKSTHLAECPECGKLLRFYRTMYMAVRSENRFILSPGFSGRVLQTLQSEKERRSQWVERILTGGCVFFGAVIALFYLNKSGIISRWTETLSQNITTHTGPIIAPDSGLTITLPLFIILLLIMFHIADKLIIRKKLNLSLFEKT